MNILDKAIIFATEKHSGATRKGGEKPYIIHPIEVGAIASSLTDNLDVISAAVLHDVLEDTDVSEEEMRKEFGDKITNLVLSDTENKRSNIPAEESWKIRKQETLDCLLTASKEEQIICMADKLSNMRAMYQDYNKVGDLLWQRFNVKDKKEQYWYYSGIAERLDKIQDTEALKEYCWLISKIFIEEVK